MSYEGATIEVVNWETYNPRTDSKRPTWFRFENSIATGPGFYGLDCEQKWLWVVILSLVSQKNGRAITWISAYVHALTGIAQKKQEETLAIFEKFSRLRVSRKVTERDSPATNERTNEQSCAVAPEFDFENLFKAYPKRKGDQGKKKGLEHCRKNLSSQEKFQDLKRAIENYAKDCADEGKIGTPYVKQFLTFVRSGAWEEWVNPPGGGSESKPLKTFADLQGGERG